MIKLIKLDEENAVTCDHADTNYRNTDVNNIKRIK